MTAQPETAAHAPEAPDDRSGPPPVRWPVFVSAIIAISLITAWAVVAPTHAEQVIGSVVEQVTAGFGWFYILLATVIVGFVLFLAMSRYGNIRLGPDHSRPEFSTFAWASMLFAAGIGTDLMFYSVVAPVTQYTSPPVGEGGTAQAAEDATVWTLFHYGLTGWSMYALMGLALAYFAYRMNLPLAVRSALHPVFGKRIDGPIGHAVDTAAVLGTIFGVATSLGIGVVFLNVGLNVIFGVPVGIAAQAALIGVAVVIATASAVSGVDKGIRVLSQLNVLLALALALWVLLTGRTSFLLDSVVMNVGDLVSSFPGMTLETFAYHDTTEWMSSWTLFFWAWWVAWASFVGQFLARISRGRTIREFIVGVLVLPFSYIVMWVAIFGNAALDRIRSGEDDAFAQAALEFDGRGFYALLQDYPAADVVLFVAFLTGVLFYVTSADSGALVMGNLCSRLRDAQEDCAAWQRIVWSVATGALTLAMLVVGGIVVLQYTTIIMGLPFALVLTLVLWGLWRALRVEGRRADTSAPRSRAPAPASEGPQAWRDRIRRALNFVDVPAATAQLLDVVQPALQDVADELEAAGVEAGVTRGLDQSSGAETYVELATAAAEHPFVYRVQVHESPVPTYGGRMIGNRDRYARLEVHLVDGGQDYDVMGHTPEQLIHDCLDQYERHLDFLRTV
ncbi:choline BCCT transporter BetT [Nocardioides hwasunensis]|uniref:Choline BCCT transporter BetT n=1 Tax=Nocardioides hwasunensis TaxID=397258 RepID=A0ABR8MCI7_9ACTN|nr:choline BCCT transporter BetT [Nocardioides hwasunensis]MBD3913856.1 choline BCCT transporter BetT [Nocardioides hwasunensis]